MTSKEQGAAFEGAYRQAQAALAASPHCRAYELARCIKEPVAYTLRIEWGSLDGHRQGFRHSPQFRAFFQAVRPLVADIVEMRHYEVTDIRSEQR